ncbi:glycoside hydrolase family 15 protein [Actinomadura logoneensis]|uniref:glycoside hydrolase family 15 protein n=1 Tax=Actinomadura logoneensis TaxID=2293572 RepID=UPI001F438E4D|nr:glycoside hydrolase family 15 protein [Actinomadura logoneensis]
MADSGVGPAVWPTAWPGRVRRAAALLLVSALAATCGVSLPEAGEPEWASPGLVGGGGWPFAGDPLPPSDAHGARYLPDSSVVRLADGRIRLVPTGGEEAVTVSGSDPRVAEAVRGDQTWLARGTVPGRLIPWLVPCPQTGKTRVPRGDDVLQASGGAGAPLRGSAEQPSTGSSTGSSPGSSPGAATGSPTGSTVGPAAGPAADAAIAARGCTPVRPRVTGAQVPTTGAPTRPPVAGKPGGPKPKLTPSPSPTATPSATPTDGPERADGGNAPLTVEAATAKADGYRDMAARALQDLRLLTRPNGASLASWYGAWQYSWPRDSAFAAAAFTVTDHPAEARRILRFLARVQTTTGMWAARYNPDGSPVADGRHAQLDSLGWVLWAAWFFHTENARAAADLPELWQMVRRAADRLTASLRSDGLPPPSSDYWERPASSEQDPRRATLGVVGPVLAGLRSAAALARDLGHPDRANRYRTAANRVENGVAARFAPLGYPRSPVRGGLMDTSVTFLSPPFGPADPDVTEAVRTAAGKLALPNGGVLPGERWSGNAKVAWTPEMALFTLSAAAAGRPAEAMARLDWLSAHRTSLGALPEKVDEYGRPAAVAPLGWTSSLVILSLSALEKPLPVPYAG